MKKIYKIFLFILLLFSFSSCNSSDLFGDKELRDLKKEYDQLVLRKEELESQIELFESKNVEYNDKIEQLKDRLSKIDEEVEETYSLFYTLENTILKSAVIVTHYDCYENGFWIFKEEVQVDGALGSGFVIKEDKSYYYIMTNNHVINSDYDDTIEHIYVYDYDLNKYEAKLMFTSKTYDMAVVRITKKSSLPKLNIIKLASKNPEAGETVIAIGQPNSQVNSIAFGNIKYYRDIVNVDYPVINHDAYTDHGNSGGMLLNLNLEVVGINTWVFDGSNSYSSPDGLSSPIEKIKEFLALNSFSV